MNDDIQSTIPQVRFPLWFKVAVGVLFATLLVPYFLLRGGVPSAVARSIFDRVNPQIAPVLAAQAALPRIGAKEPLSGAYYLNGMLVEFQTTRAQASLEEVVAKFEKAFKRAGYISRRTMVQGQPTLVALHPKTAMMLTVRPSRDVTGQAIVRLAQQDLSQLRPDFRAEIRGLPTYPGAEGQLLVQSADGRIAESLTFSLPATASATVAEYYRREMTSRGWRSQEAPLAAGSGVRLLEFRKDGAQCSVLVLSDPDTAAAFVMLTKTGDENS